jgi:hypothetical protein
MVGKDDTVSSSTFTLDVTIETKQRLLLYYIGAVLDAKLVGFHSGNRSDRSISNSAAGPNAHIAYIIMRPIVKCPGRHCAAPSWPGSRINCSRSSTAGELNSMWDGRRTIPFDSCQQLSVNCQYSSSRRQLYAHRSSGPLKIIIGA